MSLSKTFLSSWTGGALSNAERENIASALYLIPFCHCLLETVPLRTGKAALCCMSHVLETVATEDNNRPIVKEASVKW